MTNTIGFNIQVLGSETQIQKIQTLEKQLDNLSAARKQLNKDVKAGIVTEDQYNRTKAEQLIIERELKRERTEVLRTIKNETVALNSQAGSMEQLSAKLNLAIGQYQKLSEAQQKSADGMKKNAEIQELDTQLKALDAGIGRYQRNVGNYAGGFNGLSNSINQLSREMPAFANSVNTGFMAISNNIPALVDAIQNMRQANKLAMEEAQAYAAQQAIQAKEAALLGGATEEAATAIGDMAAEQALASVQGEKGQSIFKQLTSSIFSFQTAISIGVTLLTVYGGEFVKWLTKTQEVDKATKDLAVTVGKDIAQTKLLTGIIEDTTISLEKRVVASKKLIEIYPETLKNYSAEEIAAGKAAGAIDKITNSIVAYAKVKAIQADIDKLAVTQFENEKLIADARIQLAAEEAKYRSASTKQGEIFAEQADRAFNASQSLKGQISSLTKQNIDLDKQLTELSQKASDLLPEVLSEKGDKSADDAKKKAEKQIEDAKAKLKAFNEERLELQRQYAQDNINLIQDAFKRELLDEDNRYKNQIADLEAKKVEFPGLEKEINDLIEVAKKKHSQNIDKITTDAVNSQRAIQKAFNDEQVKQNEATNAQILKDEEEFAELHRLIQAELDKDDKKAAEDRAAFRKRLIDESFNEALALNNTINSIRTEQLKNQLQRETKAVEDAANTQNEILKAQLNNKQITESQFESRKKANDIQLAKQREQLEREAFENNKKRAIAKIAIDTAIGIAHVWATNWATVPKALLETGIIALSGITQAIAVNAQQFADGGLVELQPGKVNERPNVRPTSQGDNILALVKNGEAFLNREQIERLGGDAAMAMAGVPGFASGGRADKVALPKLASGGRVTRTGVAFNSYSPPSPISYLSTRANQITKEDMMQIMEIQANNFAQMVNDKQVLLLESDVTKTQEKLKVIETEASW